eukprot:gb/GECH01013149.1/.p1 GENE.gb/GECH01013149.1/~~gb/GECH01013149.1/.p1  ORF type:complete len:181 (+),score=38.84 gb/GECH01013149.1/:1-543(+)
MLRKSISNITTKSNKSSSIFLTRNFKNEKKLFHSNKILETSKRADRIAHAFEEKDSSKPSIQDKTIHITFVNREGRRATLPAYEGQSILDVAVNTEVGLEGSCEGDISCTDCHILLPEPLLHQVTEPTEAELDIISTLYYAAKQSRLACQIKVDKSMDGAVIALPSTKTRTIDDYIAQRH